MKIEDGFSDFSLDNGGGLYTILAVNNGLQIERYSSRRKASLAGLAVLVFF